VTKDSGHTFRQAAGRFASGVTVVTTRASEGAHGVTVSSFASLSFNLLLVTVSINRSSQLLQYVRSVQAFAVSALASDQQQAAQYFATSGRRPEPAGFSSVPATVQESGIPIIDGCLVRLHAGGHPARRPRDSCRSRAAAGGRTGEPLVYRAGEYRRSSRSESSGVPRRQ
jgi:flavin reductase (DIM6/NTAB) family NADH-FMN oxidoreductase RutF